MFVRIKNVFGLIANRTSFSPLLSNQQQQQHLIQPHTCSIDHIAGITSKMFLKLHCRFCYFTRRNGRWMVQCTRYGNHKSMQRGFNPKLYW